MRSGICNDFSRKSVKLSLAAEREPEAVGIGDGGGALTLSWLIERLIAMEA